MKSIQTFIFLIIWAVSPWAIAEPPFVDEDERQRQRHERVAKHWTPERRSAAIPRDFVIDPRGKGYLRMRYGTLVPHGHNVAAQMGNPEARAKKPGGSDNPSDFSYPNPGNEEVVTSSTIDFAVTITDQDGGVRSASMTITYPDNTTTQTFSLAKQSDDGQGTSVWGTTLIGFGDGFWQWQVTAKDNGPKGGNTYPSAPFEFQVDSSGSGGSGGGYQSDGTIIQDANWTFDGPVQTAAGRIYFEMPQNSKRRRWLGYVCSGTVVADGTGDGTGNGRSIILTAAHCVYDDANKAFARNVLFIPNQEDTTGSGTDQYCGNDPLGCWTPSFGVVDREWTTRVFPANVKWDYAYYVVSDSAHLGNGDAGALDVIAGDMAMSFVEPFVDADSSIVDYTHALGYSYSHDPLFRYCAQDMTTESAVNWWLPDCGLSGGSSGGPWVQPMGIDASSMPTGDGPIISVNSWGYTGQPGMAGPRLDNSSAGCLFTVATNSDNNPDEFSASDGAEGFVETCP